MDDFFQNFNQFLISPYNQIKRECKINLYEPCFHFTYFVIIMKTFNNRHRYYLPLINIYEIQFMLKNFLNNNIFENFILERTFYYSRQQLFNLPRITFI
ncbi:hypothetical protein pb186bvf_006900 [Paramecium bursaria]